METHFKQGVYKPQNSEKYIGSNYPKYRSSWQLKFFRWADLTETILAWGSENIIIPYMTIKYINILNMSVQSGFGASLCAKY